MDDVEESLYDTGSFSGSNMKIIIPSEKLSKDGPSKLGVKKVSGAKKKKVEKRSLGLAKEAERTKLLDDLKFHKLSKEDKTKLVSVNASKKEIALKSRSK
jgi:hypothetical protein